MMLKQLRYGFKKINGIIHEGWLYGFQITQFSIINKGKKLPKEVSQILVK